MINQELLDYIQSRAKQDVSREQIIKELELGGWQMQDIEEGFNTLPTTSISANSTLSDIAPIPATSFSWKIEVSLIMVIIIIGGGIYVASKTLGDTEKEFELSESTFIKESEETDVLTSVSEVPAIVLDEKPNESEPSQEVVYEESVETIITETPTAETFTTEKDEKVLNQFNLVIAEKIKSCESYSGQYIHVFTSEILQREIKEIDGGVCRIVEEWPNNGQMECNLTKNQRESMSAYYTQVAEAESFQINMNSSSGSEPEGEFIIDGKVELKYQELLSNGACVITGY